MMNVLFWVNKIPAKINLLDIMDSISTTDICSPVLFCTYGTGSYPPFEKGLHLKILHTARRPPLTAPYFSMASRPY
jgi:hypothetical protein